MSADGQRTKRLSRVHERCRQTDDRRQTDGRRSLKIDVASCNLPIQPGMKAQA